MTMVIDPIALGATLYIPATRSDLATAILGDRHKGLRSVVICLEDSVPHREAPQALVNLSHFLEQLAALDAGSHRPLIFVRPRSAVMLSHILTFDGILDIDGFVIPKATADSMPEYLGVLSHDKHQLMPTLETREIFDPTEMRRLRDQLLTVQERVLVVRIGGNDLLQTIGARRSAVRTSYDGPLGPVIANLVTTYRPWGFHLSAPVFENFGNGDLLREEVERDLDYGLLSKTAIHPAQIAIIQGCYAVDSADLLEAVAIQSRTDEGVFASRNIMVEPATHQIWAETIIRRAEMFGQLHKGWETRNAG